MTITSQEKLVDKILLLMENSTDWFQANDARCRYYYNDYSIYIDKDNKGDIYRITWWFPEKIIWEDEELLKKKSASPGFKKLKQGCTSLFNQLLEKTCDFTINFIQHNWVEVSIKQPNASVSFEETAFNHTKWLRLHHNSLEGQWHWCHNEGTIWFEHENDASLFKLSRL